MLKKLIALALLVTFPAQAAVTRPIDADSLRSSDHTKTWQLPASSGTLEKTTDSIATSRLTGTVPKANGGTGADSSSVTFPASGTIPTTTSTDTLTNKTLTAPVINSPTGLTKADVGLSNVDNTSDATKNSATATLTNKTLTSPIVSDFVKLSEQSSSPSTPAAGYKLLYPKTDGKMYTKNSAGTETQVGAGSSSGASTCGFLTNCSFEDTTSVTTGWTLGTGVTAAANTSLAMDGLQSATLTLASTNGTVLEQTPTQIADYANKNLQFSMWIYTTVSPLQVCALQGGVEVNCTDVASNGKWTLYDFNLPGTTGTQGIRLKTITSSSGTVRVDGAYMGLAKNIGTVQQAQLLGSIKIACSGPGYWGTTSTTIADFPAQTGCTYTPTGLAQAPATNLPAIKFASIPAGEIKIEVESSLGNTTSARNAFFQFHDGAGYSREVSNPYGASGQFQIPGISQSFSYSAPQSNITFNLRGYTDSGGTAFAVGGSTVPLVIRVYYFPSQSQTVTPNTVSNFGMLMLYPGATCPAGTVLADGGTTPSALVSLYGATLPDARGLALSFAGTRGTAIGGVTYSRTLLSAQGDQTQGHTHNLTYGTSPANFATGVQGLNTTTTTGSGVSGPVSDGVNGTPRVGSETRMANIAFTPCISTATVAAPLIVGGVTSSSSGSERVERATVAYGSACSASPCTITSQSGSWLSSVTRTGTGTYTYNFATAFPSAPTCTINANYPAVIAGLTTTTFTVVTTNYSGAAFDAANMTVTCVGPK